MLWPKALKKVNAIAPPIKILSHLTNKDSITLILSETFNYKDGDKKIFLYDIIKFPKDLLDSEFWIRYIEKEIEIEHKKYENKKDSRYEYIVLLSNTTHLKEFSISKEKVNEIIQYFKNKYKLTNEEIDIVIGQIN